jgi:site-specific recombinase XerD
METKVYKAINTLELSGLEVNADIIKTILFGNKQKGHTLIEIMKYHNARMKSLVGQDFAIGTYKRYVVTLGKVKSFMENKYKKYDITLSDLNHAFIADFEFYLKTHDKLEHNTAMKYIKNLKKIVHLAIENEWLDKDPFIRFHCIYRDPKRGYLTQEELDILKNKEFAMPRLTLVKDAFMFSCYTGLAYSDIEILTMDDIKNGIDGEKWITIYRKKTDTRSSIPLLPPAVEIITKYKNHPDTIKKAFLLPMISNQKSNAYLKDIATLCEIDKHLTFHVARHTFAITITLSNDVPIETVSKMLGHTSIKTTQIYSKVVDT